MTKRSVTLPVIPAAQTISAMLLPAAEAEIAAFWPHILDAPDWMARAAAFDATLAGLAENPRDQLAAAQGTTTALLEQLGEREITTLPAALLFRCAVHPGWRRAAMLYLAATDAAAIERAMLEYPAIGLLALHTASAEAAS